MMEFQIDQFVSQQREAVELGGRDREYRRDRDRRRERSRDRDRDDRRDSREHRRNRDRDRDRGDKDERRNHDRYSRSRERHNSSPEPTGYEDSSGYLREEDRYPGFNPGNFQEYESSRRDEGSSYGDTDDRYDDFSRRQNGRDKRAADKWITENSTNTIILRGLPSDVDEKDIRAELMMSSTPVKEVRLVKDKLTGVSRGFAFVEFQSVGDAQQWMEQNQGQLYLLNKYYINMYYSTPKRDTNDRSGSSTERSISSGANPMMGVVGDWICSKCGVHNFKRREHCFKCNISRDESDRGKEGDGYDQVGHNPCNTLVLRGLDALTNEETLTAALTKITALQLKNIYVDRDSATGLSKGYAFLEMNSISESTQLLETVGKIVGTFEVDGKAVMINYAKNTYTTIMATLNSDYYSQYQQGYYGEDGQYYDASQYYGQYDYSQYYNADGTPKASSDTQTNATNAAAAVAQAAISKAQAVKAIQKQQENAQRELIQKIKDHEKLSKMSTEERMKHEAEQWAGTTSDASETSEYTQYPVPDVSTYQYDESSGYYYDASTGLYYDASSQYYYNSTTGEFMYWDGDKRTYLPAPTDAQNAMEDGKNSTGTGKETKKDKVKVAKKIAKDMEKWAKTLNSQKDLQREAFKKMFQPVGTQQQQLTSQKKEAATADAGFAILERSKHDQKMMPPPPIPGGKRVDKSPALVASYGENDSDNEENADDDLLNRSNGALDESKLTDFSKMACLLCKRQFPNQEALQRHQQLSDLHKKNLEQLKMSKGLSASNSGANQEADSIAMTIQYRDRAKERREKYGAPAPPVPKKSSQSYSIPFEPTVTANRAIGSENKGNKLLQKMGWNEGQGLGKKGQGIVDPIQASKRTQGSGLGTLGASADIEDSDTYKEACKKVMLARFRDME